MSHYQDQAHDREIPTCPDCGNQADEKVTRYGIRNDCCGLWSWDRYPLVDEETHSARKAAHAAFDRLWGHGQMKMKRSDAYKALRDELGISSDQCHMKLMSKELALKVPDAVTRIIDAMRAERSPMASALKDALS